MDYGIYQVKSELLREFGFVSFEEAERYNGVGSVKISNYNKVYEFDLQSVREITLEDIYELFNISKPDDFQGHSLSTSDVVRYKDEFWYCDSIGWKKLDWGKPEFIDAVRYFKKFEVGKYYRAGDSGIDPIKVVKRTNKYIFVDNGCSKWRMRIRHDSCGNEYLVDSLVDKRFRDDYTYSSVWEIKVKEEN